MDFKKLFENNKAVSPVIGVILMVAITVILAAAIGSSVFGQGTTESAPQANFDIKSAGVDTTGLATIRIEHLGGDSIHFEDDTLTKVMASVNGGKSVQITSDTTGVLDTMNVGDVKKLDLEDTEDSPAPIKDNSVDPAEVIKSGDTINIKIIDVQTNQLICDKDVRI